MNEPKPKKFSFKDTIPDVPDTEIIANLFKMSEDNECARLCFECEDVKFQGDSVCERCNVTEIRERNKWDIAKMDKMRAYVIKHKLEAMVEVWQSQIDNATEVLQRISDHHIKDEGDYCLCCRVGKGGNTLSCEGCPLS